MSNSNVLSKRLNGKHIIFSDVQGNFNSLERFFKATQRMKKDGYICLGDIVNRGDDFDDNRCIEAVRNSESLCIKGNHEDKLLKNTEANKKITFDNYYFVRSLQDKMRFDNCVLFHSSLRNPSERLISQESQREEADYVRTTYPSVNLAFLGHSHRRGMYSHKKDSLHDGGSKPIELDRNDFYLINPGGIGLSFGLENTFAHFDFDKLKLKFFTLEEAEKMVETAEIVRRFEDWYMPALNKFSIGWFAAYVDRDFSYLYNHGNSNVLELANTLRSFNPHRYRKLNEHKKDKYIKDFSLRLAESTEKVRAVVSDFYETKSAIESREEYLALKVQQWPDSSHLQT